MTVKVTFPSAGDKLVLTVTLKDSDGAALDLTGGTVALTVDRGGANTTVAGSLVTPVSGVCSFTLGKDDALKSAGVFRARVTAVVGAQTMPSEWFTLAVT